MFVNIYAKFSKSIALIVFSQFLWISCVWGLPETVHSDGEDCIASIKVSPSDQLMAVGIGNKLQLQYLSNKKRITLGQFPSDVESVSFSSNGKRLLVVSSGSASAWDPESRTELFRLNHPFIKAKTISIMPDGDEIVSVDNGVFRFWSIEKKTISKLVEAPESSNTSITAVSPTSQYIASGTPDGRVFLWDAMTGAKRAWLGTEGVPISSLSFSGNGELLASAADNGFINVWNVLTQKLVRRWRAHSSWIYAISFGPNGNLIASTSADRSVKVWSVGDGSLVFDLTESTGGYYHSLDFSHNGEFLAGGSDSGGKVRIWSIKNPLGSKDQQG